MREHKYRAWHKTKQHMYRVIQIEWNIIYPDKLNQLLLHGFKSDYGTDFYTSYASEVDNCELMQFTGLLDAKGKEIYEGDTVLWCGGQYNITFSDIEGGWILKDDRDDWECPSLYAIKSPQQSRIQVIGNIYEGAIGHEPSRD